MIYLHHDEFNNGLYIDSWWNWRLYEARTGIGEVSMGEIQPLALGFVIAYAVLVVCMIVWIFKTARKSEEDKGMEDCKCGYEYVCSDECRYIELEEKLDSTNFEACDNNPETVKDPRYQALCYLRDYIELFNDKSPLTLVREILANRSVNEDNLIFCDEILRWMI